MVIKRYQTNYNLVIKAGERHKYIHYRFLQKWNCPLSLRVSYLNCDILVVNLDVDLSVRNPNKERDQIEILNLVGVQMANHI